MSSIFKMTLIVVFGLLASTTAAEQLLKTTHAWDGGTIAYPEGKPEITSFKMVIPKDTVTPFHCHPVPTLGYILKGQVEVESADGKTTLLREGDSAVEVMRTVHRGKALGETVEIIVFYAGATDMPNTVLPHDDALFKYCDKPTRALPVSSPANQ